MEGVKFLAINLPPSNKRLLDKRAKDKRKIDKRKIDKRKIVNSRL